MMGNHMWASIPTGGGSYAKWDQVGNTIKGIVTRIGLGKSMDGADIPELDVETSDGTMTVSASQADLKNQLIRSDVTVGQKISIKYLGDVPLAGGKSMKSFELKLGAAPAAPAEPVEDEDIF